MDNVEDDRFRQAMSDGFETFKLDRDGERTRARSTPRAHVRSHDGRRSVVDRLGRSLVSVADNRDRIAVQNRRIEFCSIESYFPPAVCRDRSMRMCFRGSSSNVSQRHHHLQSDIARLERAYGESRRGRHSDRRGNLPPGRTISAAGGAPLQRFGDRSDCRVADQSRHALLQCAEFFPQQNRSDRRRNIRRSYLPGALRRRCDRGRDI